MRRLGLLATRESSLYPPCHPDEGIDKGPHNQEWNEGRTKHKHWREAHGHRFESVWFSSLPIHFDDGFSRGVGHKFDKVKLLVRNATPTFYTGYADDGDHSYN